MIRTLLNWSGGIDSTYCLIKWFEQHPTISQGTLLVHHTRINNHQRRQEAEDQAILKIRRQLRIDGHTNYEYLETGFDYGNLGRETPIMDHEIIALWSGIILRNPRYRSVKEIIAPFMQDLEGRVERITLWENVYHTIRPLPGVRFPRPPAKLSLPIMHMNKRELLEGLPEVYRKLVWWCRRPRVVQNGFAICRRCPTCRSVLSQYPEAAEWHPGHSLTSVAASTAPTASMTR